MKIKPCIVGLGYVGLPALIKLSKKFDAHGYDINYKRIETLKKNQDTNFDTPRNQLFLIKKQLLFYKIDHLKNENLVYNLS